MKKFINNFIKLCIVLGAFLLILSCTDDDSKDNYIIKIPKDLAWLLFLPSGSSSSTILGTCIYSQSGVNICVYNYPQGACNSLSSSSFSGDTSSGTCENNGYTSNCQSSSTSYAGSSYSFTLCYKTVEISYPQTTYNFSQNSSGVDISPNRPTTSLSGWNISPSLPSGLSFNSNNGEITGTTPSYSNNTTYTVTAYYSGGSATTNITININ